MSSILKVDTIQDQNGNLIISKDSGGSGFLSPYASSSAAITYTVTVASKTSAHPYFGVGSSNGYFINGIESPIIEIKGNDTSKPYHYKFDQSDSSNSGHPLLFYNNVGKTTGFSTGVTTNGTPGQAGAYTMIAVDSQTPNILYYQCSSHANMGNHTFATSPVVNTGVFLTLPTADGSSGQVVTTNGSGVLSFAAATVADDSITLAKMAPGTDGNLITYDTSGNPAAVATGSAAQVLTSAGAGAVPSFQTATVPDDAITLAKMAPGTDGNIISYDASGNPVAVATGNDGQVLTSTGAGSPPVFETPASAANTPAFSVTKSAAQSIANDSNVLITWDTEIFDSNNGFASNKFTFPTTGKYLINAMVRIESSTDTPMEIKLFKNTSEYKKRRQRNFDYDTMSITDIDVFNANDTLEVYFLQGTGGAVNISGGTSDAFRAVFQGFKLIGV